MGRRISKPDWIRYRIPGGRDYVRVRGVIREKNLHTVCTEAGCPNIGECFGSGTATFMIMGDLCTRDCLYCAVTSGSPLPPEEDEPERVGQASASLNLTHTVVTSVTRDDLPLGGAEYFGRTVREIRRNNPGSSVELLVPDFRYSRGESLEKILHDPPDVFNHNIEVVPSLFAGLRPEGSYRDSLETLGSASGKGMIIKSGLMLGLGEGRDEIRATLDDLLSAGVTNLTMGQYLQARRNRAPVVKWYSPDEFQELKETAIAMGFRQVHSAPHVRSSYRAGEFL
jgi:lipoic acid synthetase